MAEDELVGRHERVLYGKVQSNIGQLRIVHVLCETRISVVLVGAQNVARSPELFFEDYIYLIVIKHMHYFHFEFAVLFCFSVYLLCTTQLSEQKHMEHDGKALIIGICPTSRHNSRG